MVIPDAGSVSIEGKVVNRHPRERNMVGFMPQIGHFPEHMTVNEVIRAVCSIRNYQGVTDKELFEAYHIDQLGNKKMNNNDFRQNGMGIRLLASSYDNRLSANNFLGNTFDVTTNSSSVDNVFDGNYWDKYPGYDIDKNGKGDVPYHPLSMFAMVTEQNPMAMLFYH